MECRSGSAPVAQDDILCHSELVEESVLLPGITDPSAPLRFAQDDRGGTGPVGKGSGDTQKVIVRIDTGGTPALRMTEG